MSAVARLAAISLAAPLAFAPSRTCAAPADRPDQAIPEQPEAETGRVKVDGRTLFGVVGVPALPATKRAGAISDRIEAIAADRTFDPDNLEIAEVPLGTSIRARGANVVTITAQDAAATGLPREAIAPVIAERIKSAVRSYRQERTAQSLGRSAGWAAAWTAVLVLLSFSVSRLARRIDFVAERAFDSRAKHLQIQGLPLVNVERAHQMFIGVLRGARLLTYVVIALAYLLIVLELFPWTRAASRMVLPLVFQPLATVGRGFVAELPNLVFLAVLWVLVRALLRVVKTFFNAVEAGTIRLSGFEREWAAPTFRIVRLVFVAFAVVLAYPHIPGSESGVFKGISIFAGVVFSLGSSSIIANVIAGYTMTYRRAFRVGDRVGISEVIGDVLEVKLLVTRVRSIKNEEVVIPNSTILSGNVVNFSALAGKQGLIVHVTVGIGYETPWRQVEAMLLEAAARTSGIEREPSPFIVYQQLGDFCVNYEINGYTRDASAMVATRTALQRNILDVFNEYGVQIMTPAYEGDPEQAKIVPRDQWYAAPARRPAAAQEGSGERPPGAAPASRTAT